MYRMTVDPSVIDGWRDNLRRFAGYRTGIVGVMRWLGEEAVRRMREGHPPGGPHPAPGELPVFGEHKFIDHTGDLANSITFTLEPYDAWDPATGTASALPTLFVTATSEHAEPVEFGVPGHSRPYPFFFPVLLELLPEATARIAVIMKAANDIRPS